MTNFAFLVLRFRGRGNACHLVIGKTGQIFLAIDDDRGCVLFLQNILFELGLQSCQLGIDFLELFLVLIGELRARAHEILVVTFEQIGRFRIEAELIALLIKRLDSREQLRIQKDLVMVRGKLRRHFFIDLLPRRICIAGVEVRKRALGAIEQSPGALKGDDRVVERWFLRIVRDRLDFLQLLTHSSFDRGDEMLVLNLVEGRVLIWQDALGC